LGQPLLDILAPSPSETILDIGCGHGTLTAKLAPLCKSVIGIDASANMIEHAKSLGLNARVEDAQNLSYVEEFDAIFSNAALHWMLQPLAVLKGCYKALRPGGRMVAEMGGQGNVNKICTALNLQRKALGFEPVMPWFFPNEEKYSALAKQVGFDVDFIKLFDRPTPLPTGLRQWLLTFSHQFTQDLNERQKQDLVEATCEQVSVDLKSENGDWYADYVRLQFKLTKPLNAG
jgi:trans-aconitate methyltransferase